MKKLTARERRKELAGGKKRAGRRSLWVYLRVASDPINYLRIVGVVQIHRKKPPIPGARGMTGGSKSMAVNGG